MKATLLVFLTALLLFAGFTSAAERTRVHDLIDQLRSEKLSERTAAEKELLKLGAQACPLLLRALARYRDANVRARCASILGRAGDRAAVPNLIGALNDPELIVRRAAVEALGRLGGDDAREALVKRLTDKEMLIRADAVMALARKGDKSVVAPLMRSLGDDEAIVRAAAAFALGIVGERAAVSALIETLADDDASVRAKAYLSLKQLTRQQLGFDPEAPKADRDRAISRWRAWWKANRPP